MADFIFKGSQLGTLTLLFWTLRSSQCSAVSFSLAINKFYCALLFSPCLQEAETLPCELVLKALQKAAWAGSTETRGFYITETDCS